MSIKDHFLFRCKYDIIISGNMHVRYTVVAVALACALASAPARQAHAEAYTFSTISIPGATSILAFGINNAGQVVGYYSSIKLGTGNHGFADTAGSFTTFNAPGATATIRYGINNAGQVAGYYNDGTGTHGFIATPEATSVPEPASVAVMGFALAVLGVGTLAQRRRKTV